MQHLSTSFYFPSLWLFTFFQNSGLQISRTDFLLFFHEGRYTASKLNLAVRLNVVLKCYHSYKYLNNIILCNRSIRKLKKKQQSRTACMTTDFRLVDKFCRCLKCYCWLSPLLKGTEETASSSRYSHTHYTQWKILSNC